ncbi:MAG: hypothetical protein GEV10_25490 [Streptosporangiales bacterium]|nr:hypothetical protein [Streptosporangiales bacterium]
MTMTFGATDDWIDVPVDDAGLLTQQPGSDWGDGLPALAPTSDRVAAMLERVDAGADDELGLMPPGDGIVTPAKVAANATMAGCPPEVFPIVLTAVRAMIEAPFNLNGLQATTHPGAPLVIVHGPAVTELGFNAGAGTFGPGNRANATVGRAVRLCLMNIGGARPGARDRATQGQPSKYSFCIAENAAESPWPTYPTTYPGLASTDSAVTVVACENPHNVNDHVSTDAVGILSVIASTVTVLGANNAHYSGGEIFVALGPEHAATIAASGFGPRDVQMWLYEHARMRLADFKLGGMWGMQSWPAWKNAETDDDAELPYADSPDGFRIVVTGGPGKHSSVLHSFGITRSVTLAVDQGRSDPGGENR